MHRRRSLGCFEYEKQDMGASEKVPPRGSSIPRLRDSSFSEQEARARPIVEIDRSHCIESNQNEQTVLTWTTVLTRLGATTAEDSRKAQR